MIRRSRVSRLAPVAVVALCLIGIAGGADAASKPEIRRLPVERLVATAGLLRHGDIALIESVPETGKLRQVTILTFVAAASQTVHDVVADVARYPEFIKSMTKSKVTKNADGTIDHYWTIDLGVTNFIGNTRNRFEADGTIHVESTDSNDAAVFVWEFLPAPGGTVMVMYGYTDVMHSNSFIRSYVARAPLMEHGLALAAQLVQVRNYKTRSEQLAREPTAMPIPTVAALKSVGFGYLLDRGQVAVVRSLPTGRLGDISVLDRIEATPNRVETTILDVNEYKTFMNAVDKSYVVKRDGAGLTYVSELKLPLITWETRWEMRPDGRGNVDAVGLEGDMRSAHYRWDLSSIAAVQGGQRTLAVLRANQNLGATNFVLRTVFGKEPLVEHGLAVAIGLINLAGVKARAEGKK